MGVTTGAPAPLRHPQGFDVLRVVAAAMVVVSHAFLLPDGSEPVVLPLGDFGFNLGRLGVVVFFVVSGYLVCGSWLADPRPRAFAAKRARRIMPGLVVMLLLVTFVLGPLLSTAPDYLRQPGTYAYLVRNLLVLPYAYDLPGVFETNPVTAVNGVLWTLGVEVTAYVLLAVAGLLGWLRRPAVLVALTVVLAVVGWRLPHDTIGDGLLVPVALRVEFVAYFFAAATVRSLGWRPGARSALAAAGVVALLVLTQAPLSVLLVPAGTVLVLHVGTRAWPAARAVTRLGDPSYGTYIYGFVLQQVLVGPLGLGDLPVWQLSAVSLVLCLGVGYLSWHLVEKRFLRRTPARAGRPRPEGTPHAQARP